MIFGQSGAFCVVYAAHLEIFPTKYATTAIGFCNILARMATIMAPQAAELDAPYPMMLIASFSFAAMLLTLNIQK